jgi:hypothetical protein
LSQLGLKLPDRCLQKAPMSHHTVAEIQGEIVNLQKSLALLDESWIQVKIDLLDRELQLAERRATDSPARRPNTFVANLEATYA